MNTRKLEVKNYLAQLSRHHRDANAILHARLNPEWVVPDLTPVVLNLVMRWSVQRNQCVKGFAFLHLLETSVPLWNVRVRDA
jgi:hypothetical protein